MVKVGDTVSIKDWGWSRSIVGGELRSPIWTISREPVYVVVETGCSFPIVGFSQPERHRNDTIIQNKINKDIIFIHSGFLVVEQEKHVIAIDGKKIEISHESFENLKKQLFEE